MRHLPLVIKSLINNQNEGKEEDCFQVCINNIGASGFFSHAAGAKLLQVPGVNVLPRNQH